MRTFAPNSQRVRRATPALDAQMRREAWPDGMPELALRTFERSLGIVPPPTIITSSKIKGTIERIGA